MKNFELWTLQKKTLENEECDTFGHSREIWWCSLGLNIGAEIDGKNENFERPVIIIKAYNAQTVLVLPLTSKVKNDKFHFKIQTYQKTVWAKLTQVKVISTKRLLRKVDILDEVQFIELLTKWKNSI